MDIAIGNVVGSNIFNIFFVLGITACIHPLVFNTAMNIDFIVLAIASLMFFCMTIVGQRGIISRRQGLLFIFSYTAYTAYLLLKG
jgi:cation:H+ antiporter